VRIRPKQHNFCRIQVSSELTIFAGKMEVKKKKKEEVKTQKELLPKGGLILNKKKTSFAFARSTKTKSFLK